MTLPEADVALIQDWCAARVPEHVQDQVRVDCIVADRDVTIVECRSLWQPDVNSDWIIHPVARLRYTISAGTWALDWRDQNEKWHRYDLAGRAASVQDLLGELDRDPTATFWG